MNRAARERAAVHRIVQATSAGQSVSEVDQLIAEAACRITGAGSGALCIPSPDGETLEFTAAFGENGRELLGLQIRLFDSLAAQVFATAEPLQVDSVSDPHQGDLFVEAGLVAPGLGGSRLTAPRCAAVMPVLAQNRVAAAICVMNKKGRSATGFDAQDIARLRLLAELAALQRTRAATLAEQNATGRVALLQGDLIGLAGGEGRSVAELVELVASHLRAGSAAIYLLNDDRTRLYVAADVGLSEAEREVQFDVETSAPGRALHSIGAIDLECADPESDSTWQIAAPIEGRELPLGVALVSPPAGSRFGELEMRLLEIAAAAAGPMLESGWALEEAQRRAEEAEALNALSQHVHATHHLDRVLSFTAESVQRLLNVDRFALLLYDRTQRALVTRVSCNLGATLPVGSVTGLENGISGWVHTWQTPQAVSDVAADPRDRSAPLLGIASTLCVPVHTGSAPVGVMHAMSSRRRVYTIPEIELLYTIAGLAAVAISNAAHFTDVRSKSHEGRLFARRMAYALGSAIEEQNMPQLLVDLAVDLLKADRCALYRVEGDLLILQASSRFRATSSADSTVELGKGLCGWVARRAQSLAVADLQSDPRSASHDWLSRDALSSYLAIPLKLRGRVVGVLELYAQEPRQFRREETLLLSTFARRAGVAEKMVAL